MSIRLQQGCTLRYLSWSLFTIQICTLSLLLQTSCGGGSTSAGSNAPPPPPRLNVEPSSVALDFGASFTFSAKLGAQTTTDVQWSVVEGASGGTINQFGQYTAPQNTVGTFHILATKGTETQTATATIVKPVSIARFDISPAIRKSNETAFLSIKWSDGIPFIEFDDINGGHGTISVPKLSQGDIQIPTTSVVSTRYTLSVVNAAGSGKQASASGHIFTPPDFINGYGQVFTTSNQSNLEMTPTPPAVAINDLGEAVAVWSESVQQGGTSLRSSFFAPATGWTMPITIRPASIYWPNSGDVFKVVANPDGTFACAWVAPGNSNDPNEPSRLAFSTYTKGTGWSPVELVPNVTQFNEFYLITDHNKITTIAVQMYSDLSDPDAAFTTRIFCINHYPDQSWSPLVIADSNQHSIGSVELGDLKISNTDQRIISYIERNRFSAELIDEQIRISVLDNALNQISNVSISSESSQHITNSPPKLACDQNNNIITVRSAQNSVLLNFYSPDTGWSPEQIINSPSGLSVMMGPVAMNDHGDAVISWIQDQEVIVKSYSPELGWNETLKIQYSGGRAQAAAVISSTDVAIGIGPTGTITAAWNEYTQEGYPDTYASTQNKGANFNRPSIIGHRIFNHLGEYVGTSRDVTLSMSPAGKGIILWDQQDDSGNLSSWFATIYN